MTVRGGWSKGQPLMGERRFYPLVMPSVPRPGLPRAPQQKVSTDAGAGTDFSVGSNSSCFPPLTSLNLGQTQC